ncbi:MAG: hypothetical protein ACC707_17125, partial [Thiohalomonadales bacterium]
MQIKSEFTNSSFGVQWLINTVLLSNRVDALRYPPYGFVDVADVGWISEAHPPISKPRLCIQYINGYGPHFF